MVIFISSRSFVLTIFAAVSIIYVLVAATACLVGLGWELGFLESILFAILIGISCDFVIHTGHAYTMYPGDVNRHYRSHFALTHMGPSILAAAFTTFAAAVVMVSIFSGIPFVLIVLIAYLCSLLHQYHTDLHRDYILQKGKGMCMLSMVCMFHFVSSNNCHPFLWPVLIPFNLLVRCNFVHDHCAFCNWLLHCFLGLM